MKYISTKEAAEKWGCTQATVQRWCRQGKILLVVKAEKDKFSGRWRIPEDAKCPVK